MQALSLFHTRQHPEVVYQILISDHHLRYRTVKAVRHRVFPLPVHLIQNLHIDHHELLSCTTQTVKCSGLDKAFDRTLIDLFSGQPLDKVFQVAEWPSVFSFFDDRFYHRLSDTLDRRQTITDVTAVNGEASLSFIDIRRKNLNSHLPAAVNVL